MKEITLEQCISKHPKCCFVNLRQPRYWCQLTAPDYKDLLGSRKTHRGQAHPGQIDVMLSLVYFLSWTLSTDVYGNSHQLRPS